MMNNHSITAINKVDSKPEWSSVIKGLERAAAPEGSGQVESAKSAAANESVNMTPLGDVYLRFEVNEDSRDVTIYVVDRASKNVVRTIPPEQANKLKAGDLLELLA